MSLKLKTHPGARLMDKPSFALIIRIIGTVFASLAVAGLGYTISRIILTGALPAKFATPAVIICVIILGLLLFANIYRRTPLWVRIVCFIFALGIIGLSIFGIIYTEKTLNILDKITFDSVGVEQVADITNTPFAIYISGIDTDGSINNNSRSDVNIVLFINPSTEKILIVDIPRDLYIPIPNADSQGGTVDTRDKLTHTGLYGIDTTVATVESYFDIKINYNIRVNFATLEEMVNIIGGIDVYSVDYFNVEGCTVYEGYNHLNGFCAVHYARRRKGFATGDIHRAENQGNLLTEIINKLTNPSVLASHYMDILDAASRNLQTTISSENLMKLINFQLDENPRWQISQYTINETGIMTTGYTYPDEILWMGDPDLDTVEEAKRLIDDIMHDR